MKWTGKNHQFREKQKNHQFRKKRRDLGFSQNILKSKVVPIRYYSKKKNNHQFREKRTLVLAKIKSKKNHLFQEKRKGTILVLVKIA